MVFKMYSAKEAADMFPC